MIKTALICTDTISLSGSVYTYIQHIHTCVFSSPVMSKPNGVHMCLHLTQIAIIWQFSTVLIGFCHYCYIAQSNCTQIVQMRRPVLNTSLHIVHFLFDFCLVCRNCFWFVTCWCLFSKCKKMTWWFVVSFGLWHNSERKKIWIGGAILWCCDLILSGLYSEKATKFDDIT